MVAVLTWGVGAAQAKENNSDEEAKAGKKAQVQRNVEVQASLHSRMTVTDQTGDPAAEFGLKRARVEVIWSPTKGVSGVIEAALEQVIEGADAQRLVRDAYVDIKAFKWLRFKAGQFKKPVSAMELTSKGKLPLVERGAGNGYLIRKLAYGSRDLGLEIYGRLWKGAKLDYFLGVFNGARLPAFEQDLNGTKDVVARVEAELFDGFRLGVNGVWKGIDTGAEYAEEKPSSGYLVGVDLRYKVGGLWLLAEGLWARNHLLQDAPAAAGAVLAASYVFPVNPMRSPMVLEPAIRAEWMRPNMDADGQLWVVSGGLNVWVAPMVRLMLQGEWVSADSTLQAEWPDTMRGWLQVAFDY